MNNAFEIRSTPYIVQFLYYGTVFSSHAELTLSGSSTAYMQGQTGTDRLIHFLSTDFSHNGTDLTFSIYENPTFTANGTASITAINHNRESAKTAQFTSFSNPPTPTNDGTLISQNRLFAASGGVGQSTSAGALSIPEIELVFKKNTDYALKVVNNTTSSTTVHINWTWFESGN